jgi:hypothetical protein
MKMTIETKIAKMLPFLNEKQKRLYLALEAEALGYGGITIVSKASNISRPTIYDGLNELKNNKLKEGSDILHIRRKGGGRKSVNEIQPGIIQELDLLVEPVTRGDPMSPLRWTCKSTRNLAKELKKKDFNVSHVVVAELLKNMDYSLQANRKVHEGGTHPDRDKQFKYISNIAKKFLKSNLPVISVDTKKKELVGNFKNPGRKWEKSGNPVEVNVYDFIDKTSGKAVPYGVYDIGKNQGFVNVGKSYDTSAFAVSSIKRWWENMGSHEYKTSKKLLINADCGGSNGCRRKLWKTELQKFSNDTGLEITICHFPPGTSKWNKIEHRLFSFILIKVINCVL